MGVIEIGKREKRTAFNRRNITDAAKRLFAERGVRGTTMDEIAKESDSSKSTVYVYFQSKEEIYNHIVCEHMTILRGGLATAIRTAQDFEARYYAICKALVSFQEAYPLYFESILGEIGVGDEAYKREPILRTIHDVGEEINALVVEFLREGIREGILRADIDPLPTVFVLWAGLSGLIVLAYKKAAYLKLDLGMDRLDFLRYGFDTILHSIRAQAG